MALLNKIISFPITRILLGIAICWPVFVVVQNFVLKPVVYAVTQNKEIANPIIHVISMVVLLLSYYLLFRALDKREIKELSVRKLHKDMVGGFTVGFFAISVSIAVTYLLGYYKILSISTENYPLKSFTLLATAALVEDLFHRGLIVRELEKWLGTNWTLICAMLIELTHIFNPNFNLVSLILVLIWGFTMAMIFIYTKRVWTPFFFHIGWNFAQPFYGSNLTGLTDMGTIIKSEFAGPVIFTGGAVGIENSVITIILLLAIGIFFYYRAKKEGKIIKKPGKTSAYQKAV